MAEEVLAVCTNLNLHVPEDMMIVGIAQACGYGTEAALRIAFRKRFGQSMRAGRNEGYK